MAATAQRADAEDDLASSVARGHQRFMEHSDSARSGISACFDARGFARRAGLVNPAIDPIHLYFSDRRLTQFGANSLFDEAWYLETYEDVAASVGSSAIYSGFTHFVVDGLAEGRTPNATMALAMTGPPSTSAVARDRFDESRYLAENTFAARFLAHFPTLDVYDFYRLYGVKLGHRFSSPTPLQAKWNGALTEYFDPDYYRAKHLDDEASDEAALRHYVETGAAQGHSPSDKFDEAWYRLFYTDVAAAIRAGVMSSGFYHYAVAGREEQRRPRHDLRYALEARMPGISEPRLLQRAADIERRTKGPPPEISKSAKARVWFCLPNLNPDLTFGGYKAVYEFMKAVAATGRQIGILVTEEVADDADYFLHLEKDPELRRVVSDAAYANRSTTERLPLGPRDVFVIYSIWDVYVVQPYLEVVDCKRFLLFAQEYEPIFYECGAARALTEAAYGYDCVPVFNSSFLMRFFRDRGIGPSARRNAVVGQDYHVFEHVPTMLRTRPLTAAKRQRTLAFYARPEMHASRNLFEIGYIALRRLCLEGVFEGDWRFVGLGCLGEDHELPLASGHSLEMVQKMPLEAYEAFMNDIDVGLSLMFAPHPSVVPFEFAAAGASVVTNVYENRSEQDLKAICANIIPCEPTLDGVTAALREAVRRSTDLETRERQRLRPPQRRWRDVFDDRTLDRIFASLDRGA